MPDNYGKMTSSEAPKELQDFCYPKQKSQWGKALFEGIQNPSVPYRGEDMQITENTEKGDAMKDQIVKCFYCDGDHETGSSCSQATTGITCECGGTNVFLTGGGGYQEADPSRGMPMIEGQEVACNDCGRSWWE